MVKKTAKRREPFSSISLPKPLVKEIERIIEKFGYWPNKTAFIREACLEKLDKYRAMQGAHYAYEEEEH